MRQIFLQKRQLKPIFAHSKKALLLTFLHTRKQPIYDFHIFHVDTYAILSKNFSLIKIKLFLSISFRNDNESFYGKRIFLYEKL